jgi:hypothetical protein
VGVGEPVRELARDEQREIDRQALVSVSEHRERAAQIASVDVLEGEEVLVANPADLEDLGDIDVRQLDRDLGLVHVASNRKAVRCEPILIASKRQDEMARRRRAVRRLRGLVGHRGGGARARHSERCPHPKGYTTVGVVLHGPETDVSLSANINADNTFKLADIKLADIEPSKLVSIEATLRNNSGAAVGYGRTAVATEFADGARISVPMLRPIAYISGTVSRDADGNPNTTPLHWTEAPATFSDLSVSTSLDGRAQVGSNAILMIAAGPDLYMVTQATSDPNGALTGPARVVKISTADHQVGATLSGSIDTEELRVFDAATGGNVQRYRSWCDGIVVLNFGDISGWECAAAAGQSAPAADMYEHHIDSMTFLFGKQ